ncbi:MAG: acetate--CoA ligase family protein [Candidatus Thermoplasmatota archaeon]|nr:acetate--CoA ligase family protein [Candidatus Thermoplasmatota archaeon]
MSDSTCPSIDMDRFFSPRSIAVIGASSEPSKLGHKLMRNIIEGGFSGSVFPVNPRGGEILGRTAYADVLDLPDVPDLAIIALPAAMANEAIDRCGRAGIPFGIVVSAGFGEAGNAEGEEELVNTARRHGMRILGPNVFGFIYTPSSLNAQFGPSRVLPGRVAIITQSGALGASLMGKVFDEGIGVSGVVSTGNKADIDDVDLLSFFCSDPNTDAILMYIEGLKDGRRFQSVIDDLSRSKPIIVLKSGRTEEGARVVRSHTASLAGRDRIFDGAFRQSGVLRAGSIREALDWTRALINLPVPEREEVLLITNGGGLGAITVDGLMENGIPLYDDVEWIEREMGSIFPAYATMNNPVDITAQAPYGSYLKGLKKAIEEPSIGSVIGIYSPTAGADMDDFTKGIVRTVGGAGKPVLLCSFGGSDAIEQIKRLGAEGIQAFYYPEEAVSSLSALIRSSRSKKRTPTNSNRSSGPTEGLTIHLGENKPGFMDAASALDMIERAGIPTARRWVVHDEEGLKAAVDGSKGPFVLKALSADIVHKTEAGAVVLGIGSVSGLLEKYRDLSSISKSALLMEQLKGVELIIGAVRDPVFGPCVMFGLGGTMVEVIDDVSFRTAPLSMEDALMMISETRAGEIMEGFRGSGPIDKGSIAEAIIRLGELLLLNDRIEEIEVNPLMASPSGIAAADARVRFGI